MVIAINYALAQFVGNSIQSWHCLFCDHVTANDLDLLKHSICHTILESKTEIKTSGKGVCNGEELSFSKTLQFTTASNPISEQSTEDKFENVSDIGSPKAHEDENADDDFANLSSELQINDKLLSSLPFVEASIITAEEHQHIETCKDDMNITNPEDALDGVVYTKRGRRVKCTPKVQLIKKRKNMHNQSPKNKRRRLEDCEIDTSHVNDQKSEIEEPPQLETKHILVDQQLESSLKSIKKESKNLGFVCDICNWQSSSRNVHFNFHRHYLGHVPKFICKYCNKEIEGGKGSFPLRQRHLEDRKPKHFECKECSWNTSLHYNYHRHLLTHEESATCSYCDKYLDKEAGKSGYGFKKELVQKVTDEKRKRKFCCPQCFHEFQQHSSLHRHLIIHMRPEQEKEECPICFITIDKKHFTDQRNGNLPKVRNFKIKAEDHLKSTEPPKDKTKPLYMCEQCGHTSHKKDSHQNHMLTHVPETEREIYTCNQCDFHTWLLSSFKYHMRKLHSVFEKTYVCTKCNKEISSFADYELHLKDDHNCEENVYICSVCGYLAENLESLSKHSNNHVQHTLYCCHLCTFMSLTKQDLASHLSGHTTTDESSFVTDVLVEKRKSQFVCPQCNAHLSGFAQYKIHRLKHYINLRCSHCHENFDSLMILNNHIKDEHDIDVKPSLQCKICGEQFLHKALLQDHRTCNSVFLCTKCESSFERKWNLQRHFRSAHNAAMKLTCGLCEFETRSHVRMARHCKQIHGMSPPSEVAEVEKAYMAKNNRSYSVYTNKNKRKYNNYKQIVMCELCGKSIGKYMLKRHMRAVHSTHRIPCDFDGCKHQAPTKQDLSSHIRRIHLGLRRHKCKVCGIQCKNREEFQEHSSQHTEQTSTDINVIQANDSLDDIQLQSIQSYPKLEFVNPNGQIDTLYLTFQN